MRSTGCGDRFPPRIDEGLHRGFESHRTHGELTTADRCNIYLGDISTSIGYITRFFQDSDHYAFHYDFAVTELPPFFGMTPAEFDAVTLYEAADAVGGYLRYGIPDFKLAKSVIDRRVELMQLEGLRIETGVQVGVDIPAQDLLSQCDAVCLAIGARKPQSVMEAATLPAYPARRSTSSSTAKSSRRSSPRWRGG